jgi:hypothetical protein
MEVNFNLFLNKAVNNCSNSKSGRYKLTQAQVLINQRVFYAVLVKA